MLLGLPDAAVKESQDRVFSAISNSDYRIQETRTTINLAPGDLRKEGPAYDLQVALDILLSMKQCDPCNLGKYIIAAELSLSVAKRPIKGTLAMALLANKLNTNGLIIPYECANEAAFTIHARL